MVSGGPEPPPAGNATSSPSSLKKPQPVPWTQQETVHLIQAYQDKWYSLNRGPLKASQWEEVALNVSLLGGYHYDHLSKSALQCRHKMEKLRKRYREEKRRLPSNSVGGTCLWPYYALMDALEIGVPCGPLEGVIPTNSAPPTFPELVHNNGYMDLSSREFYDVAGNRSVTKDDDGEPEALYSKGYGLRTKSKSINNILKKPALMQVVEAVVEQDSGKRKREDIKEMGLICLADEIKGMAERIVEVERKKLEAVKEMDKWKIAMEGKRIDMILDFQRKIIGVIDEAFHGCSDHPKSKGDEGS